MGCPGGFENGNCIVSESHLGLVSLSSPFPIPIRLSFHPCGMLPSSTPIFNSTKLKIIHYPNTSAFVFEYCLSILVDMHTEFCMVISTLFRKLWSLLFSSNVIYKYFIFLEISILWIYIFKIIIKLLNNFSIIDIWASILGYWLWFYNICIFPSLIYCQRT